MSINSKHSLVVKKTKNLEPGNLPKFSPKKCFFCSINCANTPHDYHQPRAMEEVQCQGMGRHFSIKSHSLLPSDFTNSEKPINKMFIMRLFLCPSLPHTVKKWTITTAGQVCSALTAFIHTLPNKSVFTTGLHGLANFKNISRHAPPHLALPKSNLICSLGHSCLC